MLFLLKIRDTVISVNFIPDSVSVNLAENTGTETDDQPYYLLVKFLIFCHMKKLRKFFKAQKFPNDSSNSNESFRLFPTAYFGCESLILCKKWSFILNKVDLF